MQYVFNICQMHKDDFHALTEVEKAGWPEPSDLAQAERELHDRKRAMSRIQEIRALF